MEKTTVILHLVSREEILAKVIEHDTHIEVFNPVQLFTAPDPQTGQMKMGIADFMPHARREMVIYQSAVAVVGIPQQELADQYAEITGDIILPTQQIITG